MSPVPDYVVLVPEITVAFAKMSMDLIIFVLGAYYFLKFRTLKKKMDDEILKRQHKLRGAN